MVDASNVKLLKQLGARILSEANDLKRTPEALSQEMGESLEFVRDIIAGNKDILAVREFMWKMVEIYPISVSDLWLDEDDTIDGVIIMRASDSESTSRIFERKNAFGNMGKYYEYRDTAMSRTAPFKPEWIKELRYVSDSDPNNPDVAFNNGHFLHQMTFFIGPVNFYWVTGNKKHCTEMNTGDSNFIVPFTPHSFTSRDPDELAMIIAITFSGEVRRSVSDIAWLGTKNLEELSGHIKDGTAYQRQLERYIRAETLDTIDVATQLEKVGIGSNRALSLAKGVVIPTGQELTSLSAVLNVRPDNLTVPTCPAESTVEVKFAREAVSRKFPSNNRHSYELIELVRSPLFPNMKGFVIRVLGEDTGVIENGLYEYVYNFGKSSVKLFWGEKEIRSTKLNPGDSACFRPMVRHYFDCSTKDGQLLCARVPGRLTDEVFNEYASFSLLGRKRATGETMKWF